MKVIELNEDNRIVKYDGKWWAFEGVKNGMATIWRDGLPAIVPHDMIEYQTLMTIRVKGEEQEDSFYLNFTFEKGRTKDHETIVIDKPTKDRKDLKYYLIANIDEWFSDLPPIENIRWKFEGALFEA